jgi:signal transduction histidine kinase
MFERRSLGWPITLGVIMIVLIIAVSVGWVLLSVFGATSDDQRASFYWTWLLIGSAMLAMILVGVVLYLTLSIKAINLNERQSNFIDSVTHELKSPIASLKLFLQTLNRRSLSEAEREHFYQSMLEDVERLDNLISNLLDVARLDRGDTAGAPEDLSLQSILKQCAQEACLKHSVPNETVCMQGDSCLVTGRKVDLEMMFRNLIDNAIKYGGDQPEVLIKTRFVPGVREGKDSVIVEVMDNGRGVPAALRKKIFGRFVRIGMELEREKPGIGLGLYLVRTLVKRLRGRIRVLDRQQPPDQTVCGTIFELQLPAKRQPAAQSSGSEREVA